MISHILVILRQIKKMFNEILKIRYNVRMFIFENIKINMLYTK